jgi:hypothetical protein
MRNGIEAQKSHGDSKDNVNYTVHIDMKKLYDNDQRAHLGSLHYGIESIPNSNKSKWRYLWFSVGRGGGGLLSNELCKEPPVLGPALFLS